MLVIIYSKLLILDVRQKDTKSYRPPLSLRPASRAKAKRRYCADARLGRSADSLLLMAPGRSWSLPLSLPDSALGPLTTLPPFPNQELALLVRSTADGQLENFPCAVSEPGLPRARGAQATGNIAPEVRTHGGAAATQIGYSWGLVRSRSYNS